MTTLPLTDHARARMQQRAIPADVLDCLLAYGHWEHEQRGAEIVWFDHRAKSRLKRSLPPEKYRRLEGKLDAYAVVAPDGKIATVGHRHKRINHK